jgi:hypothetical protein
MDRIKWEEIKDNCPWRMFGHENPIKRIRCAAITTETGLCCSESMCAPWYFITKVELPRGVKIIDRTGDLIYG